MDYRSEATKHLIWQRRGPIRKLYNLVTNIKASSSRRALFESKQSELIDEDSNTAHIKIYRLVTNGGIRWNSTYLMIARAIQLKDALMLYQTHKDTEIPEDEQLN
jgi:hypothetical protein